MAGSPFTRLGLILIVPVHSLHPNLAENGWESGPKPFALPPSGAFTARAANAQARKAYFSLRVADALYGRDSWPRRWWRDAGERDQPGGWAAGLSPFALEILTYRTEGDGLLVIHLGPPDGDLVETLQRVTRLPVGSDTRAWLETLLGEDGSLPPYTTRAMSVTFAVPAEASLPLPPQTPMLAGWTSFDQWLWQLASATTYDSYPPAQRDHDQLRRIMISLSADWSALVLRDGAAFVASRPECEPSELDFFASAEAFFRSIYLDALLLGNVQRLMLWRLADEVAALRDPVEAPAEVRRLQRQFTSFRNVYWWQHMTHHGIANDLAVAYAGQHRLSELVQQMFEELGEYARQVQTAATERVSALLAILTVIGVPVAIPIGILQVLGEERVGWLAVGVASATLVSLWMIFGLRIWRFFR